MAESIERLGFALITNELAEQERAVSGLRTCAGIVLAAASIAGSFPATRGGHGSLGVWGLLAVVAFALCSGSAIWVLLPHRFVFALDGEAFLAPDAHRMERDITEAYRALNAWSRPYVQANSSGLARLSGWLTASGVLLSIEILLWAVNLVG